MGLINEAFFNSDGNQLILSGTGVLENGELKIQYLARGFTVYDSDLAARRKELISLAELHLSVLAWFL